MIVESYIVWCPDSGESQEDGKVLIAVDAQQACEEWADAEDVQSASYSIVGGYDATVLVIVKDSTLPPERYIVSGEMDRAYSARRVQERDTSNDLHGGDAK